MAKIGELNNNIGNFLVFCSECVFCIVRNIKNLGAHTSPCIYDIYIYIIQNSNKLC